MNIQFDIPKVKSSIIKVFGVGGGGGNAVNHMFRQGIKGVDFVICNTDSQALEMSPVPVKIQIGNNLTEGRGAGSDPEVGRKAAIESIEDIKKVLSNNTKMVFVTAGMGGGTGTGAAPIIAKAAKEMGILTVGIVTSPFEFEGPSRKQKAFEGLENLKRSVDTILVINNERLRESFGHFPFSTAFGHADNVLATAAKGIAEIITVPGYINVDFEDVKTVMANSGVAIMGSASAEGEERARKAVEGALHSPLLSENDIQGAHHILLNITSGTKEITMDEISVITSYIREESGLQAEMIFGHCHDEDLGENIMVTVIATGFEKEKLRAEAEKVENEKKLEAVKENEIDVYKRQTFPKVAQVGNKLQQSLFPNGSETNDEIFGEPHLKSSEPKSISEPHTSHILSKPEGLEDLEKTPAYLRKNYKLKKVSHSSESDISRLSLDENDGSGVSIKPKNSFLHDNID